MCGLIKDHVKLLFDAGSFLLESGYQIFLMSNNLVLEIFLDLRRLLLLYLLATICFLLIFSLFILLPIFFMDPYFTYPLICTAIFIFIQHHRHELKSTLHKLAYSQNFLFLFNCILKVPHCDETNHELVFMLMEYVFVHTHILDCNDLQSLFMNFCLSTAEDSRIFILKLH